MYDFRPIETDEHSLKTISELLTQVFPDTQKFTFDFIRWQYAENPIGKVVGFNAWAGDELAAHYATIPVLWKINGKEKKGLLSLNTATHENHRGKRLFTQLADNTYQLGTEKGYEFVIGVANANSTHGFLKKLDFKLVAPLDAYISASSKTSLDSKYDSHSVWDESSLKWRLQNPTNDYLRGNGYVLSETHISALKAVLGAPPINGLKQGSSVLKLHIGLNHLDGALKFKIPKRFQPSPLNLIYRSLTDNIVPKADEMLFRLIDFDAY